MGVGLVHVEPIPTSAGLSGAFCAHHGASTGSGGASILNGVVAVGCRSKMDGSSFVVHRPSSVVHGVLSIIHYPLSIVECRDRVVSESEKARPKRNIRHESVTNSGWSSCPKGNQELMPKC
jgi:hypothetical protein